MKLSPMERLTLLSILPKEGNFLTLKIVRKLREDLSFDEKEHQILKFEQEAGMIKWDTKNDFQKDVNIGEKTFETIANVLKSLDESNKLTEQHFGIYERFVVNPEV